MRKRSGTLEIGFRSGGRPEDYEGEYQCFATNEFGVALSNKILLQVSSKDTEDVASMLPLCVCAALHQVQQQDQQDS